MKKSDIADIGHWEPQRFDLYMQTMRIKSIGSLVGILVTMLCATAIIVASIIKG